MKKGLVAQERTRADIRLARHDRIVRRQPVMQDRAQRLVFIDDPSVKATMTRLQGRGIVGDRLFGLTPFGRWQTRTFIAGLTPETLIAPWVIKGAMDQAASDIHVETRRAQALLPGTIAILDTLSTHKSPETAEILKIVGCRMLFLTVCSPDLNPIRVAY